MDKPVLAKLTLPDVSLSIPRDRLFQQIDTALQHSGLWISAPGGSGKTVLVASYLAVRKSPVLWMRLDAGDSDPATFFYYLQLAAEKQVEDKTCLPALLAAENLPDLTQFTRIFFRELYQALPQDCVLVFDNAQDQMLNEQANQLLAKAITEAPENIKVIVISRSNPPEILSKERMCGRLAQIDWSELSFRSDELRQLAKNQPSKENGTKYDEMALEYAIEHAKGWVAGFLLLLQKRALEGASTNSSIESLSENDLFDYFASEIVAELKKDEREFMLQTSFLPILTSSLAESLTHNSDSVKILNSLVRSNHFTVIHSGFEENIFEYHPLFKSFLLAKARFEFSDEKIIQIQHDVAHLLLDTEQLEAAVPLLLEIKDWEPALQTILFLSPQLLAQGRHQRLTLWLDELPVKWLNNNPWLIYWQGISQMPLDLNKSYQLLSKAFEYFLQSHDIRGASCAWAGAVESLVHSLSDLTRMDAWLIKLDILLKQFPDEGAIELKALLAPQVVAICGLRGSEGIDVEPWLETTQALLTQPIDSTLRITASFILVAWFIWDGQHARVEKILALQQQIINKETVRPLALITAKLSAAWFSWFEGKQDLCREEIEEGLIVANDSSVHHWTFILLIQGIVNALMHSDTEAAQTYFKQLKPFLTVARDLDLAYYHNEVAWFEMLEGNPEKALLQQQLALELAERAGVPYVVAETSFGLSQTLYAVGDLQRAYYYLNRSQELAEQFKSDTLAFQCGLLNAWYQYDLGNIDNAATILQATFEHAKYHGYNAFAWWLQSQVSELCAFALAQDIEPEFVRNIIKRFSLIPPTSHYVSLRWPWPVRIETLGTFIITIDNEPLKFTSKAQHRPIDLIKILVALGGLGVSSDRLAESLWPDAEGDAAARSLQTTLYRVRKLLQHDNAIEVKQGMISLNPDIVWVDVQALEGALHDIDKAQEATLHTLAQDILKLYRGPFLKNETEELWTISLRERLRGHLIKGLQKLAQRLRSNGERELARSLNEAAISADPLSEDNYRHLMACYSIADNKAEALAVYNRLCEKLKQQFNTTPSALTSQLAEAIAANNKKAVLKLFPNETQPQLT